MYNCLALVLAMFIGTVAAPVVAQDPVKRALLIGIDEYEDPQIRDLAGAVNDVQLMKAALVGRFDLPPENVRTLTDAEATRGAILDAIREHLIEAEPAADVAILHFSGHGSQMVDASGDELDGWDETLVPYDSRGGGQFDISDDEINGLLTELGARTPNIVLIMDSCHSGSLSRATQVGAIARQIPRDERLPPAPEAFARGERSLSESAGDFLLPAANYVLISGSRASQLSNETLFDGQRHGALSYYLGHALTTAGDTTTYRDIIDTVAASVTARFPDQHPQIEGTSVDNQLFGIRQLLPQTHVLVQPTDRQNRVTLSAGRIFGLARDMELAVYPPGTKVFDGTTVPIGQATVTSVRDFESDARYTGATPPPNSRAPLTRIAPPDFSIGLFIDAAQPAHEVLDEVRSLLEAHETIRLVEDMGLAELRLLPSGDGVQLRDRELRVLASVAGDARGAAEILVDRIVHWGRWHAVLGIRNASSTVSVDLQIRRGGAAANTPSPESITAGAMLDVSVTNTSGTDLHMIVLDLASDGSICVLYPSSGACRPADVPDAVPSGETLKLPTIQSSVPDDREYSVDIVKVIATTQQISPTLFALPPTARSAAPASSADEDPLARYLRQSAQGLTRNLQTVAVDGWTTSQRTLRVVRPTVERVAFALHFDSAEAARAMPQAMSRSRSLCGPTPTADCYETALFPGDDTIVEVRTPATRSGQRALQSVGAAFDEAYEYREETRAVRAEPLLVQDMPRAQTAPTTPGARGGDGDDPRAEQDPMWSLKHIRAEAAWSSVRAATGQPEGLEAKGIVVAHPDTGYRRHPEIWAEDPDTRPAWPEMGYDYYAEDDDPTDDLLDVRLLDHPAHGTGSGSAIVSPTGCELAGKTKCASGPARGARLVPLRVHRSVVHFNTKRMTQVILDASGPDRSRVKTKTDVMSISMGGVPSYGLWKAVRKAEERGYLIIAASGNYVRTVVWPARFDSVIAVAATDVGCRPWPHTSRGKKVDFSAPGESVWRAEIIDDVGDGQDIDWDTGMGTGTTYATATTAGIAALWLAQHAKESPGELAQLKANGRLTETFRSLVEQTVWVPGTDNVPDGVSCDPGRWKSRKLGAGIIDAAALIEKPLSVPRAGAPRAVARTIRELPLWASLYPPGTPDARMEADYRALFAHGSDEDLEEIAYLEGEVTYHYAVDERVTDALDALVESEDPTTAIFSNARSALRNLDISSRLRDALPRG